MTNSNTTVNRNGGLNVCEVCKQTGKNGAQWLVYVDGSPAPTMVHKPCGQLLIDQAPDDKKDRVRLVPSRGLRDEWARDRAQKAARSFWEEKFSQAKPLQKPGPIVMTVTTPSPATVEPTCGERVEPAPAVAA